jgi:hypothetical protein
MQSKSNYKKLSKFKHKINFQIEIENFFFNSILKIKKSHMPDVDTLCD